MRHPPFRAIVESLDEKVDSLLAAAPFEFAVLPKTMPQCGIYLFSEGERHLYVGRSNRIRKRLSNHCRPSATHYQASFAFRLAREATGLVTAFYSVEGSRSQLAEEPTFRMAFEQAKSRLRSAQIRFVEEVDPIGQAILEIYVAMRLGTPYNDFDTH
jgi:predicted GIY-YIG superfamily endonuclease